MLNNMFIYCPKIERTCAMCAESTWNPHTRSYSEETRLFCGGAPPSFDITVDSLPQCPLNMTKSQKATYTKKMKARERELFPHRFYGTK